ncbi:hypothetical protein [Cohaesibacter intestini]|uniref:hypothetical protein n=1 Tax=Cohaesibacter intestini TaxID=2211145 RepID=UPI000DEB4D20|nr:hypothetical protein [Cohaesibacter intestini]
MRKLRLLLAAPLVGMLIWFFYPSEPKGSVFKTFTSPDGRYVVTVYRYVMSFALPGGGGSDAPGRIELTCSDGRLLHKAPVPMVIMAVDEPEWFKDEVRLPGILDYWPLSDPCSP